MEASVKTKKSDTNHSRNPGTGSHNQESEIYCMMSKELYSGLHYWVASYSNPEVTTHSLTNIRLVSLVIIA